MPSSDDRAFFWTFKDGYGERKRLPFPRPRCPGCRLPMRAIRTEWFPAKARKLGPLWTFTCGRQTTPRCQRGISHLNARGEPVTIPRPRPELPPERQCSCGSRVTPVSKFWYHQRLKTLVRRVRCPRYRKGVAEKHVHEVRDRRDQRVILERRPLDPGWRPRCGEWRAPRQPVPKGCGAFMVKGHSSIKQAEVDTYYCNKSGCPLQWQSFHWLRGSRRPYAVNRQYRLHREAKEGKRPQCCGLPMYRREGKGSLRKFVCRRCRKTTWWNAKGEPVTVKRATFPRISGLTRARCPDCRKEMAVQHRVEWKYPRPRSVYFMACGQRTCEGAQRPAQPYDARGTRLERPPRGQALPWERGGRQRPVCHEKPLLRGGSYIEEPRGRRVFELRCRTCHLRSYFDEKGKTLFLPLGRLIRVKRYRHVSERKGAPPCLLCHQPRMSTKYCEEHNNAAGYARHYRQRRKQEVIRTVSREVGPPLRSVREALRWRQAELARALEVSPSRVSRWEGGKERPKEETRKRLEAWLAEKVTASKFSIAKILSNGRAVA